MPRLMWQLLAALLLNICVASGSMAADWQVVRVTGLVWVVAADMEPRRAAAGMVLPQNATLATMRGARAMLQHGEDLLNVGPETAIAPQARRVRGLTTVLMREGKVELDIEHRSAPHFAVQTPFLAAVVKGTRFTVTVSDRDAAVSLETGRVQVTGFAAGETVDLTSGQTAEVGEEGLLLSGGGALPATRSVASQAPMVEAAVNVARGSSGSNAGGNGGSNAGGNSGGSNAGGNSGNSNAGGNSGNSNAGGNSGNSNAGGNSGNSNAGGNGNGNGGGNGNGNGGGNGNGNGQ